MKSASFRVDLVDLVDLVVWSRFIFAFTSCDRQGAGDKFVGTSR
jgi:hypothetical protein